MYNELYQFTKTSLRKKLKEIGYKCKINEKQSPFSDKIVTFISLILPNGRTIPVSKGTVYSKEFYDEHKQAFDIINTFIDENK